MAQAHWKPREISEPEPLTGEGEAGPGEDEPFYYDDGLLAVAGPIMAGCYLIFFSVAAVTFFSSGAAFFAVAISIFFALVFFAIPIFFFRQRAAHDARWRRDGAHSESALVDTWTGPIRRGEALAQILSIPLAILMGFTLLAIRWGTL